MAKQSLKTAQCNQVAELINWNFQQVPPLDCVDYLSLAISYLTTVFYWATLILLNNRYLCLDS